MSRKKFEYTDEDGVMREAYPYDLKEILTSILLDSTVENGFKKVSILFDEDSILFNDDEAIV
jgi:hypothetical protein